jgi:hypothetical protein
MIRLLTQMLTVIGLVAAIIWVAASGLHLWQTPIVLDASATTAAGSERAPHAIANPAQPPLAAFPQSLVRPLFFEARRLPSPPSKQVKVEPPKPPPPAPPPPPPKPAVLPDKIKLLGVVMQADDRKALIEIPPQPAAWFKVGDKISEWTITEIEENNVILNYQSN